MRCPDITTGEYLLFTEVDWRSNIRDSSYVASIYGPGAAMMEDITEDFDKEKVLRATMRCMVANQYHGIQQTKA